MGRLGQSNVVSLEGQPKTFLRLICLFHKEEGTGSVKPNSRMFSTKHQTLDEYFHLKKKLRY